MLTRLVILSHASACSWPPLVSISAIDLRMVIRLDMKLVMTRPSAWRQSSAKACNSDLLMTSDDDDDHLSALKVGQGDLVLADVGLGQVPHLNVRGQHPPEIPELDHPDLFCRNLVITVWIIRNDQMCNLVFLQQPLVVPVHHVSVGHHEVPEGLDPLVNLCIQLPAQLSHLRPKPGQFFGNRVVHIFVGATFILVFEETKKF